MTINISADELACDCDHAWQTIHGQTESINGLTGRLARGELSDAELTKAEGCKHAGELHAKLYPDHVSQDEYRQAWFAAKASGCQERADVLPMVADTSGTNPGTTLDD